MKGAGGRIVWYLARESPGRGRYKGQNDGQDHEEDVWIEVMSERLYIEAPEEPRDESDGLWGKGIGSGNSTAGGGRGRWYGRRDQDG